MPPITANAGQTFSHNKFTSISSIFSQIGSFWTDPDMSDNLSLKCTSGKTSFKNESCSRRHSFTYKFITHFIILKFLNNSCE